MPSTEPGPWQEPKINKCYLPFFPPINSSIIFSLLRMSFPSPLDPRRVFLLQVTKLYKDFWRCSKRKKSFNKFFGNVLNHHFSKRAILTPLTCVGHVLRVAIRSPRLNGAINRVHCRRLRILQRNKENSTDY